MAGDWIKMRVDLVDDPAVLHISQSCSLDIDAVIGKLHRLWSWADKHTEDGHILCAFGDAVDRITGTMGFAEAMQQAGWLAFNDGGLVFPRFTEHNGNSAKRRCLQQKRMKRLRAHSVTQPASQDAHQRREEKSIPPTPLGGTPGDARKGRQSAGWIPSAQICAERGHQFPRPDSATCYRCGKARTECGPEYATMEASQ